MQTDREEDSQQQEDRDFSTNGKLVLPNWSVWMLAVVSLCSSLYALAAGVIQGAADAFPASFAVFVVFSVFWYGEKEKTPARFLVYASVALSVVALVIGVILPFVRV